ncbi:MAG: GTPase [Gammaproteobacteria bacterium]|nr:GTPase [Gammaproteobacteria bacterium]
MTPKSAMFDIESSSSLQATATPGTLNGRLNEYAHWRTALGADIQAYRDWLEKENMLQPEDELRLFELIESLNSDKLSIALVAEFSRGKTELINAIFFADQKQRLLPSTAGRTTMCPTEIQYDADIEPCIMLLPIETRKTSLTINEYKRAPINWSTLPLDITSPAEMAKVMRELVKTQTVSVKDAQTLGLYFPAATGDGGMDKMDGKIEIPIWRHAIINYPHPLLEKGMVILDTPGLNALGTEPELTLNMLPNAHAVLFVLAADTGVTKTDLDVWKNHVCIATRSRTDGRIAILNKIDTLWDELLTEDEILKSIDRQTKESARQLDIKVENVFPVSAQKGLLSKIKSDPKLLKRSGLRLLEEKISTDIVAAKQGMIREKVTTEIGDMIQATAAIIQSRLATTTKELQEIQGLCGKSAAVLDDIANRLREQKRIYDEEVESFEITRRMLSTQIRTLLSHMSMTSFDKLIAESRKEMKGSWTTAGLRTSMVIFFEGAGKRMERVNTETRQIKELVESIYTKFHADHGLAKIKPASFSVLSFRSDMQRLQAEADNFRNSTSMMMTEQHFVIKKFFITLVSRARELFYDCNRSTKSWAKFILTPIYTQIQEHKIMIDRRLENLEKIQNNHTSLATRIQELEAQTSELKAQEATIHKMMSHLRPPASGQH